MPVFEFLRTDGTQAFGPFEYARPFRNGAAVVQINGRFGAIDRYGELIVEPRFEVLHGFDEGRAAARLPRGKMGYVGLDGQWVIEPSYNFTLPFVHGFAAVVRGGKIPDWAVAFQIGPNGGKWGAVNLDGERVTEEWWNYAAPGDGLVLLNKGGKANGFVLPTGGDNRYLDPMMGKTHGSFETATPFSEGLAIVRRFGEGYSIVGHDLENVAAVELNALGDRLGLPSAFTEGRATFEVGVEVTSSKYAIIDTHGATVIDDLGFASPFNEGIAAVNRGGTSLQGSARGGQWGFIDRDATKFVTRPQWRDAIGFAEGLGLVGLSKGMRFVDREGETVFDVADWARPASGGFILHRVT